MKITKLIDRKAFTKMNKFRKRVAIAKDVLARIEVKNIEPYNGRFGNIWTNGCPLQKVINDTPHCEVCAKGALAMSWIGNFNKYVDFNSFSENLNNGDYPSELLKIFGRKLLDAIEIAFEGQKFSWHTDDISYDEADVIEQHFDDFSGDSKGVMIAVFQNIIDNKGKLVCDYVVIE